LPGVNETSQPCYETWWWCLTTAHQLRRLLGSWTSNVPLNQSDCQLHASLAGFSVEPRDSMNLGRNPEKPSVLEPRKGLIKNEC